MSASSPIGFRQGGVVKANNVNFTGDETDNAGKIVSDGQILIGATAFPNIRAGSITSLDGTVTITAGPGTIDLSSVGGVSYGIDAATLPGTNPTLPTAGGLVTITGSTAASQSIPIRTYADAVNAFHIEAQISSAAAATDATQNGLAHFDSASFAVDANGFVTLLGGGIAIDSVGVQATSGTGTDPVIPTAAGLIDIDGAAVAAQSIPIQSLSASANQLQIEVQRAADSTGTDTTSQGLASFNDTEFIVDANGYASLINGLSISSVDVDANTGPGTDPVLPSAAGVITVSGTTVAAQTIPIRTNSLVANAYNIELQISSAAAGANATLNGLAHFDSASFAVDADGFVTLAGGGLAIDSIGVQATSGTGTDPVVPTAAGLIDIDGAAVAAQSIPVQSLSASANQLQIEIQRAASSTGTDATSQGLASFDDTQFTVDASGYVTSLNGLAISSVGVDANTGPGTDPVLPTSGGLITVQGTTVAAQSIPIRTNSLAANTYNVEIQRAASSTGTDATSQGVASFDDSVFTVDASGYVTTIGATSGFQATFTTSAANQTGDGTAYTVIYDSELSDVGGNYNNATGVYTAPVDGLYQFNMTVLLGNLTSGHTAGYINFITTSKAYVVNRCSPFACMDAALTYTQQYSVTVLMSATDTAYVTTTVSGSTKTVTIFGDDAFGGVSTFSGGLLLAT